MSAPSTPSPIVSATPRVSVVIPTYNRCATLPRAMASVLDQSFADLELIVVDDGSTDGTPDLVRAMDDPRIRLIVQGNAGAGGARNTGMAAARGDLIAFQDSDDEWLRDKLARQVAAMDAAPAAPAVYCAKIVYGIDRNAHHGGRRASVVPDWSETLVGGDIRGLLYTKNLISTQTLMLRRAVYERLGGFVTIVRNSEEWDFVSRIAEVGPILFVDAPLVVAYRSDDSISLPSKRSAYSMLVVANRMKRRGAPQSAVARHVAGIGTRLGYYGQPRLGRRLIRGAIARAPAEPRHWIRLAVSVTPGLMRTLSSWRRGASVTPDRVTQPGS